MGHEKPNSQFRRTVRPTLKSSESGMALVLLLIATTIITMTCIGLIDIFTLRSKTQALSSQSANRDALLIQLRRESRVGLNLYASIDPSQLPANDQLRRHIVYQNGDAPNSCRDLRWAPDTYHSMRLVSDAGTTLAGAGGSDFAYYDKDGNICVAGGNPCVMKVSARFGCYCNDGMWYWDGGAYCNVAKGIDIQFTVEPVEDSNFKVSKRTVSQYVPIQDWGFGQWSLITFNKEITVRQVDQGNQTPDPQPTATPDPVPVPAPGPSGPSTPPAPTPVPTPVGPTPTPPPAPMTESCDAGTTPVNGKCEGFSI